MIIPGFDADLLIMDKDFNLIDTVVGGKFIRRKIMRVIIKNDYDECSLWAAHYVAYKIKAFRPTPEKPFVLGLPTGSTPLGMYQKLIEMVKAENSRLPTWLHSIWTNTSACHRNIPRAIIILCTKTFSNTLISAPKTSIS